MSTFTAQSPYPLLPVTAAASGTSGVADIEPNGKTWTAQFNGNANFVLEGSLDQEVTWATLQTITAGVPTIVATGFCPKVRVTWSGGTGNQSVYLAHN